MANKLRLNRFTLPGRRSRAASGDPHLCTWKAVPSNGGYIGLAGTIVALAGAAICILVVLTSPSIGLRALIFGFLGLACAGLAWFLGELTFGYFRMRYVVNDERLIIRCAFRRESIPLRQISYIMYGKDAVPPRRVSGVRWPGYNLTRGYLRGYGDLRSFTTAEFNYSVLVCAQRHVFALSPVRADEFISLLRERAALAACLGETAQQISSSSRWDVIAGLFTDTRTRVLTFSGLVLNVALFAVLAFSYSRLPGQIPVHFNAMGQPDIIGETFQIFKLPAFGLVVWSLNTIIALGLLRRERFVSYLLLGSSAFVQLVFWGATAAVLL
jgi:Bacterial PH domain/Protein of unknown function (DUF1648)